MFNQQLRTEKLYCDQLYIKSVNIQIITLNMSKVKVTRTQSTPVIIPGKRILEEKRKMSLGTPTGTPPKSILKRGENTYGSSVGSDNQSPCSSPERKSCQVRFSERNLQSPDYCRYEKGCSGNLIVSPMSVFRKITLDKMERENKMTHPSDCDSVNGLEGSDDEDELDEEVAEVCDNASTRSSSPLLRISSSMSNEAQYAILKAYEDEMFSKIAQTFPEMMERLDLNRCGTPDIRHTDDFSELVDSDDEQTVVCEPRQVAIRIQRAMDILDSVRESTGELITSSNCSNRSVAKNPVRSFKRWCHSLKEALQELQVSHKA